MIYVILYLILAFIFAKIHYKFNDSINKVTHPLTFDTKGEVIFLSYFWPITWPLGILLFLHNFITRSVGRWL